MEDKEKKIEEMRKCEYISPECEDCKDCAIKSLAKDIDRWENYMADRATIPSATDCRRYLAKHLLDLNYRKLPKNSVVLSREEWEDYKKYVDNCIEEYYRG